jgi:selenocysteine lyase/cysteine desulfurase
VAARLGDQGLFVWAGHYYAVEPMARLGLLERGGLTRIGFVHTTTEDEVDRLLEALSG